MTTRAARRAKVHQPSQPAVQPVTRGAKPGATSPLRLVAFLAIALLIVGGGVYLASSVFLGQRGTTTTAGAIPMRISMAGFEPKTIDAKPGQAVTLDWWNTDGAMHLERGVHTMVSDAMNLRLELPAESRKTITVTAPTRPGDYDFWCDSCCGGKENGQMHGTLHVAA